MKNRITDIICALLAVLFVYAASSKLFDYNQFRVQLGNSPLIALYAGVIAWVVPTVELVIVLILTVKNTRSYGLQLSLVLLIIFTGYIAGMLLSGTHLPCSCGGVISGLSWKEHLLFNLFFMALNITGIVLEKKESQAMPIKKSINIKKYFT